MSARPNRLCHVQIRSTPDPSAVEKVAPGQTEACESDADCEGVFDDLDAPVERVGMAEVPLPYAKNLETAAMPNEDRIAAAVLSVLD